MLRRLDLFLNYALLSFIAKSIGRRQDEVIVLYDSDDSGNEDGWYGCGDCIQLLQANR